MAKPHAEQGQVKVVITCKTTERACVGASNFVSDIRSKGQKWNNRYKLRKKGFVFHLYKNTLVIARR